MSQERKSWVWPCLCISITLLSLSFILGLIVTIYALIFGSVIFIITLSLIGIVYFLQKDTKPTNRVPSTPDVSISKTTQENKGKPDFAQPRIRNEAQKILNLQTSLPKSHTEGPAKPKTQNTTAQLKQQITDLENRVRSLREQLADDPYPELLETTFPDSSFQQSQEDQELIEKAIEHLLKTLDEKLAKHAISKQLYNRLRDKYIARLEKTKSKREASSKWGTKESGSGDQ